MSFASFLQSSMLPSAIGGAPISSSVQSAAVPLALGDPSAPTTYSGTYAPSGEGLSPIDAQIPYEYSKNKTYRYSDPQTGGSGYERFDGSKWVPYQLGGEHDEERAYQWAGIKSDEFAQAERDKAAGAASALENVRLSNPGALGQSLVRSEESLTGRSGPENNARQELAFYSHMPEVVASLKDQYTPEMQSEINQQIRLSSPAEQSKRAEATKGGLGGFGSLLMAGASMVLAPYLTPAFGSIGTGALLGGVGSAITGGDPLKGAITGGIGGAISGYTSGLEGGSNFVGPVNPENMIAGTTPEQIIGNVAKGAVGPLINGKGFGAALTAGALNAGTSAIGTATGSPIAGAVAKGALGFINTQSAQAVATTPTNYIGAGIPAAPIPKRINNQSLNLGWMTGG